MHLPLRSRRVLAGTLGLVLLVAGCASSSPPATARPGVPILGASRLTAAQLVAFYRANVSSGYNATVPLETLAGYYIDEGAKNGVRGDLAFVQGLVETGWFRMSTNPSAMVPNTYNNFAGIGACDTCAHGFQFATAQLGVRRQIQALRSLADPITKAANLPDPPVSSTVPSGAWNYDTAWRKGKATTWNQMGGVQPDGYINWASAPNYADVVIGIYSRALTFNGLSGECPPDGLNLGTTAATGRCPASIAQPGRAIAANPNGGYYTLSGDGTVKAFGGAPNYGSPRFDFDIARDIAVMPDGHGYAVLDGYGAMHYYGSAVTLGRFAGPYWPGWDIARSVAITPSGNGFVILDGFGGLHTAGDAPAVGGAPYWPNWDIARSIAIRFDNQGYWVLDGYGGIHTLRTAAVPAGQQDFVGGMGYWPGHDVARELVVVQNYYYGFLGAFVIDSAGALHSSSSGYPTVIGQYNNPDWVAADRWRGAFYDLGDKTVYALRNDGLVDHLGRSGG